MARAGKWASGWPPGRCDRQARSPNQGPLTPCREGPHSTVPCWVQCWERVVSKQVPLPSCGREVPGASAGAWGSRDLPARCAALPGTCCSALFGSLPLSEPQFLSLNLGGAWQTSVGREGPPALILPILCGVSGATEESQTLSCVSRACDFGISEPVGMAPAAGSVTLPHLQLEPRTLIWSGSVVPGAHHCGHFTVSLRFPNKVPGPLAAACGKGLLTAFHSKENRQGR